MRFRDLLPLALALGCAPNPQAPVAMMAIVKGSDGTYTPTQVNVVTLRDIVAMKGDVANLIGNATIKVDQNDPALMNTAGDTNQQLEDIFLKNKGQTPTGSYIQKGDVFWPADFHTWNMVTAYYDYEQAFDFFQNIGVPSGISQDNSGNITCAAGGLCGATIYYWPTFTVVQASTQPQVDNVLFYSPVQAFLLLPFDQLLTQVPLQMNQGVLTHEYAHRIFNGYVYQGELFPQPIALWPGPQINMLKSIDEGLADWFGYSQTCLTPYGCDALFLADSFGATFAASRDMSAANTCMSQGLLTSICTLDPGTFISLSDQYQVGTMFAAALYHAGKDTGQAGELQKAVIASYSDTTAATLGLNQFFYDNLNNSGVVTLGAVVNTVLLHIADPALQEAACNNFMDHLQLTRGDICPSTTLNCGCPTTAAGCTSTTCCPVLFPTGTNTACPGF